VPTDVMFDKFFVVIIAYPALAVRPTVTAGKLNVSWKPDVPVSAVELGLH